MIYGLRFGANYKIRRVEWRLDININRRLFSCDKQEQCAMQHLILTKFFKDQEAQAIIAFSLMHSDYSGRADVDRRR